MIARRTAPRHCPACSTELYPIAHLRPRAGLSPLAKVLVAVGLIASSAILICGMAWAVLKRESYEGGPALRPSGGVMGLIVLIPAVVPGLIMGWLAHRMPKLLKLRCPKCPWREQYQVGSDGQVTPRFEMASVPVAPRRKREDADRVFDQIDAAPPLPPRAPVADFDVVGDESVSVEISAWIYAELAGDRTPEEVSAELVAKGWDTDVAEGLVEQGRRQTRPLRP